MAGAGCRVGSVLQNTKGNLPGVALSCWEAGAEGTGQLQGSFCTEGEANTMWSSKGWATG